MKGEELDLVRAALEALRSETRHRGAPERVEKALVAAFRKRHAPARRAGWVAWAVGAAAAGAAVVFALATRTAPQPAAPPKLAPVIQAQIAEPPPVAVTPAVEPVRPKPVARRRVPARTRQRAAPASEPEEFVPLPYARMAPPATEIFVTRMQLSRVSLAAAGLPVNMDRTGEAVLADVMFAGDGTARAVRILK